MAHLIAIRKKKRKIVSELKEATEKGFVLRSGKLKKVDSKTLDVCQ